MWGRVLGWLFLFGPTAEIVPSRRALLGLEQVHNPLGQALFA